MKKLRIALAQIKYYDINPTHNLLKIKKFIEKAKKAGADIICFPESVIHKETLPYGHNKINEIREECKKNSIWCIVTHELIVKGKEYNTALLINREGKIVGDYKKINLFGDKLNHGKKIKVFQTDFAKIGIVICWDLAFPQLFREMKRKGAQIIFCPSQWWYDSLAHDEKHEKREVHILESLVLTRAYENICFIAICNPVINSKYQVSYSAIVSPTRILKRIVGKEGMIVSEINLNEIKRLEKIYR